MNRLANGFDLYKSWPGLADFLRRIARHHSLRNNYVIETSNKVHIYLIDQFLPPLIRLVLVSGIQATKYRRPDIDLV